MVKYIESKDLVDIVDLITQFDYKNKEKAPNYDREKDGIDNYFSLMDRAKEDVYYPEVLDKASFLFININNHYFSNGNKRLALVTVIMFLEKNNYTNRLNLKKDDIKKLLNELFIGIRLDDVKNFDIINFGLYNLALIVARKGELGIPPEVLKEKVKMFFSYIYKRK